MERFTSSAFRTLLLLAVLCVQGSAQNPPAKQNQPVDVIRINTELIQTGVVVLDKHGHFVDGLQPDQFELRVEGKPQPISFFEQIKAGSARERARLASLSDNSATQPSDESSSRNDAHGRTIVFFIDDLHLALDSLGRTRKTLSQFIENEMNETDQVAIASTSGDIGFLQQFSDNKAVLRAAAGRLIQHPYNVKDMTRETTPMTEYMALTIERKDDPGVFQFYVDECLNAAPPRYPRKSCEVEVINRARMILSQAASVIVNTYTSLESLMHSSLQLPGRKLVFFISDGFLLDTGPRNADPRAKIGEITEEALRAGVVIYTIDARGLFTGQLDATNNVPVDIKGRLESASMREIPASQDAMNALAEDSGGRALRNQNYFDRWVNKILDETSNYYLLAWRPNDEEQTGREFKNISARIIGHPEFTVRLPRGFRKGSPALPPTSPAVVNVPAQPHQELQQALTALHPRREIPISLSVVYLDTPEHGPVLTASVRVANDGLSYDAVDGKQVAAVDVVGVAVNDRGKPAGTFQTRLKINAGSPASAAQDSSSTIYNYRMPLAAGLYQVRIATRDIKSGQVGSAQQWIEIPDLASHRLSLSSLLLNLQNVEVRGTEAVAPGVPQFQFSTDHRFARNSRLSFITFIYNATRGEDGKSQPNIWLQARLLRGGQIVKSTRMQRVTVEPRDVARIPFGGEIVLDSISSGQYLLEVTVEDQFAKTSASQHTRITVE
jgi:VWFA-related protein